LFASHGFLAACSLSIITQAKAGRGELHLSAVFAEDKRVERILGTENLDPVDGRLPDRADPVVYGSHCHGELVIRPVHGDPVSGRVPVPMNDDIEAPHIPGRGARQLEVTKHPGRLRPRRHVDTFWFAWEAYYPDTELYTRVPPPGSG
jgi:hypothetical protein